MKTKLLLLHGALGSAVQFSALKETLEDWFEVHTLNFEGHGGRSTNRGFAIRIFAENVLQYLDEKGIDKINIFGYSMGGYVALYFALSYAERVGKIITLGTKFKWDREIAAKEAKMLNPEKIEVKVPHFADQLKQLHAPADWKVNMRRTAALMLYMGEGAKLADSDFPRIPTEVIIGIGDLDKMVTYEESEWAQSLLPNAKLVRLKEVKHPIESIPTEVLTAYITSQRFG